MGRYDSIILYSLCEEVSDEVYPAGSRRRGGLVGSVQVTPPEMYPGSDAANMALLGYDPTRYYTGRGPIEAAAIGVPMEPKDVAFRCSLVSTDGEKLIDYSAGHISTEEARPLIELANQKLGTRAISLFPG